MSTRRDTRRWLVSQNVMDHIPEDDGMPSVASGAMIVASRIVADQLQPRVRVDADGTLVIPHSTLHRIALIIEHYAQHGEGVLLDDEADGGAP